MTINVNELSRRLGHAKKQRFATRQRLAEVQSKWDALGDYDSEEAGRLSAEMRELKAREEVEDGRVVELAELFSQEDGRPVEYHLDGTGMGGPLVPGCHSARRAGDNQGWEHNHTMHDRRAGPRLMILDENGNRCEAIRKGESCVRSSCDVSVEDYFRGLLVGNWNHVQDDNARLGAVQLAMESGGAAGVALIPGPIVERMIDVVRARSRIFQAGAQVVLADGLTPSLKIARVKTPPTAAWRGELEAHQASAAEFESVVVYPYKIRCDILASREILRDAPNSGPQAVQLTTGSIAAELDRAALLGGGGGAGLTGIVNTTGVQSLTGIGTPSSYNDIVDAVTLILGANYDDADIGGLAWLMAARDFGTYSKLVDLQGQPLRMPELVSTLQRYVATAIQASAGETQMIVGDFRETVIFVRQNIEVELLREGVTTDADGNEFNAVAQDGLIIRATMRAGMAVLRPSWYVKMSGVTA